MNINQLPYIIAIASNGSLTAAARQLEISQSALSRYLSALESELGIPLFIRKQKRLYPTQAGAAYLKTANQILDLMNITKTGISQLGKEATRSLRIGLSHQTGISVFSSFYLDFQTLFPDVKLIPVEGYAEELKASLLKNECDIIFTSGEEYPGLDFYRFTQVEMVLAIPRVLDSPYLPQGTISDLDGLRDCVFVLPEPPNALYTYVDSLLKAHNFIPQVVFSTPNLVMARQFILSGIGIGFLQDYHVKNNPDLRLLHLEPKSFISIGCYTRASATLTPEMRCLQYLWLKYTILKQGGIDWTDHMRTLVQEFDADPHPEQEGNE